MTSSPTAKSTRKKPSASSSQQSKSANNRAYYEANREALRKRQNARHARLNAAERTFRNWRQQARPAMPKPGTERAKIPRNVQLALAFCDWSDTEEVVRMNLAAALMTELTGVEYVVDHVIPLVNPFVCGLHTHTNMQVITRDRNRLKSNMFWPGMPALTWESLEILENLC